MTLDGDESRKVRVWSETLARHLGRRYPREILTDASYNLQYGQYDEFVSNIFAAVLRREIALDRFSRHRLRQLIDSMKLQTEMQNLMDYIEAHPEPPGDRIAERFA